MNRVRVLSLLALAAVVALAPPLLAPSTTVRFAAPLTPVTYEVLSAASPSTMMSHVGPIVADVLGVPPPPFVRLHLYRSRGALRNGLVRHAGLSPSAAFALAATSVGLALPRTVLLLTSDGTDDRVRLIAHELTHLVQLELTGPAARPAQWLMEGTAEWTAFSVLERLGAPDVAMRRVTASRAARRFLAAHPRFTPGGIGSPDEFTAWRRRTGDALTYQVVYVLAERLVRSRGVPAVVAYFRSFREPTSAATSFERSFDTSMDALVERARHVQ